MKPASSFLLFLPLLILLACNNSDTAEATKPTVDSNTVNAPLGPIVLTGLLGTWQSEDGKSFERWVKDDSAGFRSVAFSVSGKDTSWNESAKIYEENGHWIFDNTVRGQNNGKPIQFVSSVLTDNSIQFSNPAHDFPTDINYTLTDNNTLHAFIIGPGKNGGKDTIPFDYRRLR